MDAGLCCGSRLRKGEVFAFVGLPQNKKDLNVGEYEYQVPGDLHTDIKEKVRLVTPDPQPMNTQS